MDDYWTRVAKYYKNINPVYMTYRESFIRGNMHNKALTSATVNPSTQEPIFWMFRFSSFIPVNIPICFGLITSKTVYGQMFWQMVNQSYNVGFNYANKTRTNNNEISNTELSKMYTFAVVSSCTISGLITHFSKNLFNPNHSHLVHTLSRGFIPFVSVFLSSQLNLYFVRRIDMEKGIPVYDSNGVEYGKSVNMAWNSFTETATCRTIFRFCSCMFPPLIEYAILKNHVINAIVKTNPMMWTVLRVGIITACLYGSMPLSFAFYPEKMKVNAENSEIQFKNKDLYYNRGI